MTQSPLEIVRAWQEKSLDLSVRTKDRLFAAISKGFDAMTALLAKDSDPVDVQIVLGYFNVDRTIALQVDKAKDDSLRDIVYGLLESMHVSLNEWNEERIQRKETGEISTQTEEFNISFLGPIIPSCEGSLPIDNHISNNISTLAITSLAISMEPIEEQIHQSIPQHYQISTSQLMRDEKIIMKEEMDNQYFDPISPDSLDGFSTTADFTRSLLPFTPREEPRDEGVTGNNQIPSLIFPPPSIIHPQEAVPIDFVHHSENMSTMGNFTTFNPTIKKEEPVETQEIGSRDFMEEEQNGTVEEFIDFVNPSENMSTMGNFTTFNPKIKKEEPVETQENRVDGQDSVANDLIDNEGEEDEDVLSIGEPTDTPKDTSDSNAKVEKMKRSSRHVSRPIQYTESMQDSDDDGGPSEKRSRSDSTRKDDNKRASIKGEDKSESGRKKLNVSKENATELECPECSYSTRIVKTWLSHLSKKHSTTPSLAGLALLCECGHESLSEAHSLICNRGNTTVIRKRDGPIGRLDDEKITPQCVICEEYPKTAYGYAKHLDTHHKSTLAQNGIYLICSCDVEIRSRRTHKHTEDCNPRLFTLHKLDDE